MTTIIAVQKTLKESYCYRFIERYKFYIIRKVSEKQQQEPVQASSRQDRLCTETRQLSWQTGFQHTTHHSPPAPTLYLVCVWQAVWDSEIISRLTFTCVGVFQTILDYSPVIMKVILTLAALAAVLAEPELKDSGLKVRKYRCKQIRVDLKYFT